MQELCKICSKSCLPPETKESWLKVLQRKTLFGHQIKHIPDMKNQLETAKHILLRECPVVQDYISAIYTLIGISDDEELQNSCPFSGPLSSVFTELTVYVLTSLLNLRNNKGINIRILAHNVYT